jgi:apolipoprotein N-acyltransferase
MFLAGVSWVYVSLHDFGGMAMPVAGFFTLLFCAYLAVFPALVGALLARIGGSLPARLMLGMPALWALSEWARGWIFTGFPWLALGYSQVPDSPLAGFAPVLGVFGVSLVAAAASGALAWSVEQFRSQRGPLARRALAPVAGSGFWLLIALLIAGAGLKAREWTQPLPGEPTTVSLLQGNIPQEMKWRPERALATLETYLEMVRASDSRLILLPETALPMYNVQVPADYLEALARHARSRVGDVLVGVPELADADRFFNSVMSFGTSVTSPYRKHHLVPFGDYFPLRPVLGWVMHLLHIPMSDFSRGEKIQSPMAVAGQKIAVNICYEDAFGEEVIRQLPEATLLANFTNDAWWGNSIASRQHLQIAQTRALETGRPMLRATNTGVTAIIDARGYVTAAAPEFVATRITGLVRGYEGATPYVRAGNLGFLGVAGVMLLCLALLRRRRSL